MNLFAHITGTERSENSTLYHWTMTDGVIVLFVLLSTVVLLLSVRKFVKVRAK